MWRSPWLIDVAIHVGDLNLFQIALVGPDFQVGDLILLPSDH